MAFWIVASVATDLVERLRPAGGMRASIAHRARQIPRAMVGMMVAHLGVAVFIFGVTLVRTGEVERDVQMAPGDTTTIGDLVFTFRGASDVRGPNYRAAQGEIEVDRRRPHASRRCAPRSASTRRRRSTMTEAAIDAGLHARPVRLARRAGRERRGVDRARLRQAVRRLDLGRLPA